VEEAQRAGAEFGPPQVILRAAQADDLAALVGIELAAGAAFRDLGMDAVADDDPGSVDDLAPYAEDGRVLVAADAGGRPIGYLLLDLVDGAAHIEQVSVHPDHARQGIGRALIGRAERWARSHGLDALTLTAYRDVPWNGPYYERLGFVYLTAEEETPGLKAIREQERRRGLDKWPRGCMRLPLQSPR